MNRFSCDLEMRSSHNINQIEFSGKSSYVLDEEFHMPCPYGNEGTHITIKNHDAGKIKIEVCSENIDDKNKQAEYLKKIATLLSSILGFRERNPHYGTPFITLDLHTFISQKEGPSHGGNLQLSDSFSIESTHHVKFSSYEFSSIQETDLLSHYYNALKAEGEKSKFFHLFLILEILEGCDLYKRTFPDGTLFSENEKTEIRAFAEKFSPHKKSALLGSLSRTEKFRNEKLLSIINAIGVTELNSITGKHLLDQSTIKDITIARNKLFHKSEEFDSNLLYNILFPLTTQIVEIILNNPECIS